MLGFEFCDEVLEIDELLEQCFVGAKVIILGVDDGGGLMALVGCEVDGSVEGAAGNADGAGLFCHLFCSPIDRVGSLNDLITFNIPGNSGYGGIKIKLDF